MVGKKAGLVASYLRVVMCEADTRGRMSKIGRRTGGEVKTILK